MMYKNHIIYSIAIVVLSCTSAIVTHSAAQTLIDTFDIKNLNGLLGPNVFSYLYEDKDHYYYFVDDEMINISREVINGEIVYEYELNELSYEVDEEIIESSLIPSKIDTNHGTNLTLIKFTKEFEIVNYAIFQNISGYGLSKYLVEDFKIKNGKIYFITWANTDYPLLVNDREYAYEGEEIDPNERQTIINSLIVLREDLELEHIKYFPTFKVKGIIPRSDDQIIIGGEIWRFYEEAIIGKDTIQNNRAEHFPGNTYRENAIIALYNYEKDSAVWTELISNSYGVQLKEMEENYNQKEFYIHVAASSPFVYIGTEDFPTDSIKVNGFIDDLFDYYRDHLLIKFDDQGNLVSSIGIPEGLYDSWHEVEIDKNGDIFLSIFFTGEEIQIRDSIYINEFVKNGGHPSNSRSGVIKFDSIGNLKNVLFFEGNYSTNLIYEMKLGHNYLYLLKYFIDGNIIINDSIVNGFESYKDLVIRVDKSQFNPQIIFDPGRKLNSFGYDIKEVTKDTLIFIGNILGFESYSDSTVSIIKLDLSNSVLNRSTYIAKNTLIKLYPNPVKAGNSITIDLTNHEDCSVNRFRISNINGNIVFDRMVQHNEKVQVIDLPDVIPGTYFVQHFCKNKVFVNQIVVF